MTTDPPINNRVGGEEISEPIEGAERPGGSVVGLAEPPDGVLVGEDVPPENEADRIESDTIDRTANTLKGYAPYHEWSDAERREKAIELIRLIEGGG